MNPERATMPGAEPTTDHGAASALRVLLAGASGGIGGACAERLRGQGHDVAGIDRPEVDITLPGGAEQATISVRERLGGIDAVVHAVGMSGRALGDGSIESCSDEAWSEVMRVNLESAFRLMRATMPCLAASGGGSVVLVGSVLADSADPDFLTAAYSASKAGLRSLARTGALEGAAHGVRVNLVAPALVDTPMASRARSDDRISRRIQELHPLGGAAVPATAVADAVAFLVSRASGHVTGACLPVDAGWMLR